MSDAAKEPLVFVNFVATLFVSTLRSGFNRRERILTSLFVLLWSCVIQLWQLRPVKRMTREIYALQSRESL